MVDEHGKYSENKRLYLILGIAILRCRVFLRFVQPRHGTKGIAGILCISYLFRDQRSKINPIFKNVDSDQLPKDVLDLAVHRSSSYVSFRESILGIITLCPSVHFHVTSMCMLLSTVALEPDE